MDSLEKLHNLYSSLIIVRRIRLVGYVGRIVRGGTHIRIIVRKPEGKRPLGRPRRRWVDNIEMDLGQTG
jgi:hypothetical protein